MVKKNEISPAKLFKFLQKLYEDLERVQDCISGFCPGDASDVIDKDDAEMLVDSMLSDVGDQLLLLPRELHAKYGRKTRAKLRKLRIPLLTATKPISKKTADAALMRGLRLQKL